MGLDCIPSARATTGIRVAVVENGRARLINSNYFIGRRDNWTARRGKVGVVDEIVEFTVPVDA